MDSKTRLAYLLGRRHDQTITKHEEGELSRLLFELSDAELTDVLHEEWERSQKAHAFFEPVQSARMLGNILGRQEHPQRHVQLRRKQIMWQRFAAAAAILIFIGFGLYQATPTAPSAKPELVEQRVSHDALPGGNRATLALSGGKTIVLDSADNGLLATLGGINVQKAKDGQLIYRVTGDAQSDDVAFNTLSTPRGGQYQIVLPDGSKVWLNAASSLRFPAVFKGKERRLELTGEAYFEVASNPDMPFKVVFGNTEVEVLGTHFNIMAYDDEAVMEATLLEGSVSIRRGGVMNMLRPGQQASMEHNGVATVIEHVDVSEAVAWKDGLFQFHDADLQSVMREAARWYDLDVTYEGDIPQRRFTGRISRNVKASELLSILKYTGVNFKIEDKKIIVIQQHEQ